MLAILLLAATILPVPAAALVTDDSGRNLSSFGSDITIPANGADNVSCIFCSVRVQGDVRGSVSVIFGDLTIDPGTAVDKEVSVIGGDLLLKDEALIGDNMSLIGGQLHLDQGASIRGNQSVLSSKLWLLMFLLPFVVLAAVIWLIVWLIQRTRRA